MFLNKHIQSKISTRKLKSLRINYQQNLIENHINTKNFTLFYLYDFITKEHDFKLTQFLKNNNLHKIKIRKNLFKNKTNKFQLNFLSNLITNNTLLIYHLQNDDFSSEFFIKLKSFKNIYFLGIFLNKIFYRPSELNSLLKLNSNQIRIKQITAINSTKNLLQKTLTFKNYT